MSVRRRKRGRVRCPSLIDWPVHLAIDYAVSRAGAQSASSGVQGDL
jgi:hypothetical protein